jgi:hypothetical protein
MEKFLQPLVELHKKYQQNSLLQCYRTCGRRAQNGTRQSLLSQFFNSSFPRPASLYCADHEQEGPKGGILGSFSEEYDRAKDCIYANGAYFEKKVMSSSGVLDF